jgi:hypothetical protein
VPQNTRTQLAAEAIRSNYRILEQLVAFKMSLPSATYKDVERYLESMARMVGLLQILGEEL